MDCQKHGEVVGELMLVCPVCPASVLAAGQELEAKHAAALEVVKAAKKLKLDTMRSDRFIFQGFMSVKHAIAAYEDKFGPIVDVLDKQKERNEIRRAEKRQR